MSAAPAVDGRTARAQRTRSAVVDALLELINEGDLRPTAPRIAERAKVSLRSVFQHFTDLEALFAAATQRQIELIADVVQPLPAEGPLSLRVEAFVAQRTRVLETLTNVQRASILQEPFSAELRKGRDELLAKGRAEVARTFRQEIESAPESDQQELLDALDGISTWAFWEHLRARQELSVERAQSVMKRCLLSLLGP
jgi:AcrR family transcriptional regulator